ncbi:hypothetical protein ACFPPD_09940 [Cohnella suwonensis]|uniref:Uncharacterized protein n=1 Tax=Cohnella suwonensis TaxID=696072 RepID=A0ABW0LT96_9BACL
MATRRAVYSTGILRRPPKTKFALADIVNLTASTQRVTVQVFDWSNGTPVPLKVSPCGTRKCAVTIAPHRSVFLYADVSKVQFKYEVRIAQNIDKRLISNVTGFTNTPFTPQNGDTVLQNDLIRIR